MDLYLFITEGGCYPQLMFGPMKFPGIRYKYKKPAPCTFFLLLGDCLIADIMLKCILYNLIAKEIYAIMLT